MSTLVPVGCQILYVRTYLKWNTERFACRQHRTGTDTRPIVNLETFNACSHRSHLPIIPLVASSTLPISIHIFFLVHRRSFRVSKIKLTVKWRVLKHTVIRLNGNSLCCNCNWIRPARRSPGHLKIFSLKTQPSTIKEMSSTSRQPSDL